MKSLHVLAVLWVMLLGSLALAEPTTKPALDKKLISVQFEQVPLSEILKFLGENSGVNIVLQSSPGVDTAAINVSLNLKQVSIGQVLELITKLPGYEIRTEDVEDTDAEGGAGGNPIKVVTVSKPEGANEQPHTEIGTLIVNLSSSFDSKLSADEGKKKMEQITALIDAGLNAAQMDLPAPKIYFHPETHILIVRGTMAQRNFLTDLTSQMQKAPNQTEVERKYIESICMIKDMEAKLQENRGALADAEARTREYIREMERSKAVIDELKMRLAERAKTAQ